MDWLVLLYNAVMLGVDAAAGVYLWRRRTVRAWLVATAAAGGGAVLLAVLLGVAGRGFTVVLLAAYGLFVHGSLGMLLSAWILWPARRGAATVAGAIAAVLIAVGVDGFLIEPYQLDVTRYRIVSDRVERPTRIVVVADLQTDKIGAYETDVLREVMWQKPDLILLAGDYSGEVGDAQERLWASANTFMRRIQFAAPMGVFAIRGNCDGEGWEAIVKGLPAKAVEHTQTFDLGGLWLTCLSLRDSLNTDLKVARPTSAEFHVVMGHSPNFALGAVDGDLLLAGHTHGGQVRLPWIGPLLTLSKVPRAWAAGMTELTGGRRLIVSRGIGMERDRAPLVRFLCRPQLVVIDLVPGSPQE